MNEKAYQVGGLLYSPASNAGVADNIINERWGKLKSVSLCLEDSISDGGVVQAEETLKNTLTRLKSAQTNLPMLFVRVRTPEHLRHIHDYLGAAENVLTGYIFPKFDLSNAEKYMSEMEEINRTRTEKLYAMPILESVMIAQAQTRVDTLTRIKDITDRYYDTVLNIRVGGNDFCNLYGLRRNAGQTIYDIGIVRDILVDILNVFSMDYVVSGPVWEYFGTDTDAAWAQGLRRELELDRLNGFLGKTSIHPSQIPLINDSMKVSRADYEDAKLILNWTDERLAVAGSSLHNRMNEVKCHARWAKKMILLAKYYGVKED